MDQFWCSARLSVITLGLLIAGCGDGQQSDSATKMKAPMGDRSTLPTHTAEPDPHQPRQNKVNEMLKKAEAGDVVAMVELGKAYDLGRNWGKTIQFYYVDTGDNDLLLDREKAAAWYGKAAEQGNAEAQGRLGRLFFEGSGVQQDFGKALELFQKAATQGDAIAQFGLGVMYGKGDGTPKDESKFQEWIQKAADQGLPDAQNLVAAWYSQGYLGVSKDAVKAVDWLQKAASQGHAFAQLSLGQAYRDGKGVPKDTAKAIEWYGKSAVQGLGVSQFMLGIEYFNGKGSLEDNVLAYAWLNLASSKGDETAAKWRDLAVKYMTAAEIAEAQRLSSSWKVGQLLVRESGSTEASKQPSSPGGLAKKATGTAFIVNMAGHAITNHHVVEGCAEIRVEGRDSALKVVTFDVVNDLALLQIPGKVAVSATVASEPAKLRQGEEIMVFGFPLNSLLSSGGNMTPGVVSALTGLGNNTNQIQITAPIQPGSSGSPVLNKKGEIVGVVSMKLSDSKMAKATGSVGQNVNFAVSGQTLKTFLDTHNAGYRSGSTFSFGSKSTADLADEARKWTLVVECWK
jgi:uncharacterized protein